MMFWGLVLEPSKRYTQKVSQSFHLSQAALELGDGDSEPMQLILEYEGLNYVLGTLSKKANIFQIALDLNFNTGDEISFRTIGRGRVHLTGYHIAEDDLDERLAEENEMNEEQLQAVITNSIAGRGKRKNNELNKTKGTKRAKMSSKNEADASEDESLEDYVEVSEEDASYEEMEEGSETDVEEEEDVEEYEEDTITDDDLYEETDVEEDAPAVVPAKKKATTPSPKTQKINVNGKSPKVKKQPEVAKPTPKPTKKNVSPVAAKVTPKTPKSDKKSPKIEKKDQNKPESTPQKKVVEGGVIVEEIKIGEGPVAKPGKMVQVYYVGRLQSNKKQFDSTTQGPGFKFRLGRGEVIRGWDIGVNGMKVGGKRKITIPAQLGYGAKGAPPAIPPNSVLIFEVELKAIN